MIGFILGLVVGTCLGLVVFAFMFTAKGADEDAERRFQQDRQNPTK